MAEKTNEKPCAVCQNNTTGSCPKCQLSYCSLTCYKHENHVNCTEAFYKQWVQTELENSEVSDEMRRNMLDILQKEEEKREEEERSLNVDPSEGSTLSERLSDLDLDNAEEIWQRLNDAEKKEFQSSIENNIVHQFLPLWQPWWLIKEPLIAEADTPMTPSHPELLSGIPTINVVPSPSVGYNIANVLSSYIFMAKYYNGDHHTLATEASHVLLELSKNLSSSENFEQAKSAIFSVIQMAVKMNLLIVTDAQSVLNLVEDLIKITSKPIYPAAALSDVYRLLKKSQLEKEEKSLCKKCLKKLLFYMNYCSTWSNRLELSRELELLKNVYLLEAEANKFGDKAELMEK